MVLMHRFARHSLAISCVMLLGWCTVMAAAAQAPSGQAPPAAGGRGRGAAAPATRIVIFEAQPATIKPGESALLVWHIENPPSATGFNGFGTIEPAVGRVAPRGSQRVAPIATTTYTLTAGTVTKTVTVTVPGTKPVTAVADASAPASTAIRRTPDGKPDFSGIFGWGNLFGARGGGAAPPALKPGAEKYRVTRGALDTGPTSDCLPLIPPNSFGVPYEFQFIQNKNYLLILHEYPGTFRIIPLDGEPHQADPDPSWLGDSVGRWEGDTLVIDTVGYNEKTEINGYKHTEALHTVERLTRVADGVEYELTIEDPNVFAAPWKVNRSFKFTDAPQKRIFEFVCENNRDYKVLFGDRK